MTLAISQSLTAIAARCKASFFASGGTSPYVFSVAAGGAGGVIDPVTGSYTAPLNFKSSPIENVDTIVVVDAVGATAQAQILVGSPLLLFCDIIAKELGICRSRVYVWDQKINQPTDCDLFVAVSVFNVKPFGTSNRFNVDTNEAEQFVAVMASLNLDIISRGPVARDRKEEVLLALNSVYAEQQQAANNFKIARLSSSFINLSEIDGAAIPYRFRISVNMQYSYPKQSQAPYFDEFNIPPGVVTNS